MPRGHYDRSKRHHEPHESEGHDDASHGDGVSQQEHPEQQVPIRMTSAYSFYDRDDALHSWAEGQIVTDPTAIETLRKNAAPFEPHYGELSGLHPDGYPVVPVPPQPHDAPLRLTAPFAFDDRHGRRFWAAGEIVTDPSIASMLRRRGAPFEDVICGVASTEADPRSPLRLASPYTFFEADGTRRFWTTGERVDDPETAALLRARGALVVDVE